MGALGSLTNQDRVFIHYNFILTTTQKPKKKSEKASFQRKNERKWKMLKINGDLTYNQF